ncbi:uncharacterized protein LOC126675179 [Mercurialis annua]|uniref:uncharacterized protein LOC126675179 n=1 Tax=Mercurialis annua TaxID=3986 RepID=UPI00215E7512|nr:uncharacterized protein LOC126675179 [Mercurialis annua]
MAVHRIEKTDLWKSKARVLQLRFKDRFRVAVDRHRQRSPIFSGYYFSSTVQRWITRFHEFRQGSLQSSSAFYRKTVGKEFDAEEESLILRMLQSVAVPLIGNVCHVFMNGLNRVQVFGLEKLHDPLLNRPKSKPLLTVSNHVAAVDDPFVIASLLPPTVLLDAQNIRWTLCASDRCFRNPVTSAFFRSVKVLPVDRGEGIYQKGMDMAIAKLNSGGWVHIFPEGSRSRDGGKTMGSSKRGVGRLILDADTVPVVIPFVHLGMQEIMPIGANFPRVGKTVTVLVGDPILFDDLLNAEGKEQVSRGKLYDAVASRIGSRLLELKIKVESLALEQSLEHPFPTATEKAAEMVQRVDWDSFGMGSHEFTENNTSESHQVLPNRNIRSQQESIASDECLRTRSSYIISKMHGFMDSTELLGFAAKGVFTSIRTKENKPSLENLSPLRAWRRYLEAYLLRQCDIC